MPKRKNTSNTGGGGNSQPHPNMSKRSRKFVFTVNNYSEKHKNTRTQLKEAFEKFKDVKYIMGYEIAPTTGTPHIQGYVQFKNAIMWKTVCEMIPHSKVIDNVKGTLEENLIYCSKTGDYITNCEMPEEIEKIEELKLTEEWQIKLEEELKEKADNRTIRWIYDEEGNSGKTYFCKYMYDNYGSLYLTGKAADMKFMVCKWWLKHKKTAKMPIIFIDLTRSTEMFVSYQGIEEIKNGIFMSSKFECEMVRYNPPHVVIFSNFLPDYNKLSSDRWKVENLLENDIGKGSASPDMRFALGFQPEFDTSYHDIET